MGRTNIHAVLQEFSGVHDSKFGLFACDAFGLILLGINVSNGMNTPTYNGIICAIV